MATLKPAPGALIPVLRYARRNDLDGQYLWDWHAPGTAHHSRKAYRTRFWASWDARRWRRAAARAGAVETVDLDGLLQAEPAAGAAIGAGER